jgi:hypothetical protein
VQLAGLTARCSGNYNLNSGTYNNTYPVVPIFGPTTPCDWQYTDSPSPDFTVMSYAVNPCASPAGLVSVGIIVSVSVVSGGIAVHALVYSTVFNTPLYDIFDGGTVSTDCTATRTLPNTLAAVSLVGATGGTATIIPTP